MNYAALVLLGEKQGGDNDALAKGRSWIFSHGSATAIPQWGKVWLSVSVCDFVCIVEKNTMNLTMQQYIHNVRLACLGHLHIIFWTTKTI
jgi:squalene cyclase